MRVLATSRVPLGDGLPLEARHVDAIHPDAAAQLVLSTVQDLTPQQAGAVAAACRCVPLVLCLVAEALQYGRLAFEVRRAHV